MAYDAVAKRREIDILQGFLELKLRGRIGDETAASDGLESRCHSSEDRILDKEIEACITKRYYEKQDHEPIAVIKISISLQKCRIRAVIKVRIFKAKHSFSFRCWC